MLRCAKYTAAYFKVSHPSCQFGFGYLSDPFAQVFLFFEVSFLEGGTA